MENRTEKGARISWKVRDNREMGEKPMRSRRCKGRVTGRRFCEMPLHEAMWEGAGDEDA